MIINVKKKDPYNIEIKKDLGEEVNVRIARLFPKGKVCIITDSNVDKLYSKNLESSLRNLGYTVHKLVFPPGEHTKDFEILKQIQIYLAKEDFTKSDFLVALGGGVIGDLTGFAASIYMRGIKYVQIPTSLLAMVDSSVGGKTAVNLNEGKNLVGTFWQPAGVFIDPKFLETLPEKEIKNGLAEIIKCGLIKNKELFYLIHENSPETLGNIIEKAIVESITVKKEIIEIDERDKNLRQVLNFGHTIGHALEKCSNYNISHGQGVAIGCLAMTRLGEKRGWIKEPFSKLLKETLLEYKFDLNVPYSPKEIAKAATNDKKRQGELINLIIATEIGKCTSMSFHYTQLENLFAEAFDK